VAGLGPAIPVAWHGRASSAKFARPSAPLNLATDPCRKRYMVFII